MTDRLKVLIHFLIHMVVAAVLFGAVALVALAVYFFTEWMRSIGAPYEIWIVCYAVSELIFWLDVLCFVVFVLAEVWLLLREIWQGVRYASGGADA